MSDLRTLFSEAVQATLHDNEPRGTVGVLDAATGVVQYAVPGYPQYIQIMVQQGNAQTPHKALNRDCPHIYGLPIVLRKNAAGNEEAWIDSYRAAAFLGPNGPPLGVAFHSHRWGTGLEDIVEGERIQPGMIHTKTGLTVTIEGFYYDNGSGTQAYFPTTDVDLTASMPSTAGDFAWLKIGYIASTGAVQVNKSTEKSLKSDLTPALLAATTLSSSAKPLGGVKVQTGQTSITNQGDIADGREWFGGGGGGSISFGTPAVVLGTAAAAGAATTALRTDCTIVAFDTTAPSTQAFGDAAAVGAAAVAARRDHKHAMPVARTQLTAARTYYVRTDGNDSNTGLVNNAGGAWLTLQHAVNVTSALDNGGNNITVNVADGTYAESVALKSFVGSGYIKFVGNTTTPANCVIAPAAGSCVVGAGSPGVYWFSGFKFTATAAGGCGLSTGNSPACNIWFDACEFGACALAHTYNTSPGGVIQALGNYRISGDAQYHHVGQYFSRTIVQFYTVTLVGTRAFTIFCYLLDIGHALLYSNTYSGSATGQRYNINDNSKCATGGATLPGNAGGATATGGLYS